MYTGRKRVTVLAVVQSMGMLSPIISPVIGAIILSLLSWRGVFGVLTIIGILSLLGSIAMEETIEVRNTGSILKSIGRLGVVAKNESLTSLLITFSMMSIASMSFISASSLMSCAYTFFSSIGMVVISLNFSNRILIMGLMYAVIGVISLLFWIIVSRKPYIKHITYHVKAAE